MCTSGTGVRSIALMVAPLNVTGAADVRTSYGPQSSASWVGLPNASTAVTGVVGSWKQAAPPADQHWYGSAVGPLSPQPTSKPASTNEVLMARPITQRRARREKTASGERGYARALPGTSKPYSVSARDSSAESSPRLRGIFSG